MPRILTLLSLLFASVALTSPAKAGSCCATAPASLPAKQQPVEGNPLAAPLPAVLDAYAKVQTALADDTVEGLADAAQVMAKLLTDDANKTLPDAVAQAETLGRAKTVAEARPAFKALTNLLVRHLTKEKVQSGQYQLVYCEMAKAHWLQTDKTIKNPYYGKAMLSCGQVVGTF